jgi:RNA recognition motif-containing protein
LDVADSAGESRGFGFVKMQSPEDAEACIKALNGVEIDNKVITVAHVSRLLSSSKA